jgi:hypothetical protein
MVWVNEAWEILSNPATRANYDAARLHADNKEYVRKAETESRNAREQAEQYPRDWDEFETWMDKTINAVINDFKKAEYGETSFVGERTIPTAGKSLTGWIFIIVGGILGFLLAVFILSGLSGLMGIKSSNSFFRYFGMLLSFSLVSAGAWCGKEYHETIKKKLGSQKPFSHSKPDEKSKYNRPINWKAVAIVVAIVIILFNLISLISTTPEGDKNSVQTTYIPPPSQTLTFSIPPPATVAPAAPTPSEAAPSPTSKIPATPHTNFRYNGYLSGDHGRVALVNGIVHHEGDLLGANEGYVLKSIHSTHIVILNKADKSEFVVPWQY